MKFVRYGGFGFAPAILAVAVLTFGCSSGTTTTGPQGRTTPLTQEAADDIAQQFATTMAREGLPVGQVGGMSLSAIARGEMAGLQSSKTPTTANDRNFSWSFIVTFYDAADLVQETFDRETTARMTVSARARGSASSSRHQAFLGVARDLDVHGLLPEETTLEIDGTSADTADCSFESRNGSVSREYHLLADGSLTDVMKLKDESENPYPLSGVARWHVKADALKTTEEGTKEAHYEATVTITFNGTRHPSIEVNKTFSYTFDMETGELERMPS